MSSDSRSRSTDQKVGSSNLPGCASVSPSQGAKDVTGNLPKVIEEFNKQHPQGQVTLHELPDAADQQRQQMVQNTQIKNPKMAVLSVDNVWTAEFVFRFKLSGRPVVRA